MSTSNENDYTFVEPTTALQNLAQIAGDETREEAVAAKQTPVSKLTYTAGCKEITAEYYRTRQKNSSSAKVLDHERIKNYYKPEVFALINGPVWIRPLHIAVVIPLIESGSPKITVTSRQGKTYDVAWRPGSIHYLGGDVSLNIEGGGRAVFVFLLFEMAKPDDVVG